MKFSIIIPAYNRPQELHRALVSCLRQSHGDFEIIVVDDCSKENIKTVCDNLKDPRIHYLRNSTNLGASGSRNHGLASATGDYISFLDSDDLFLPHKLMEVRNVIGVKKVDIVLHSQYRVFSNDKDGIHFEIMPKIPFKPTDSIADFILRDGNFLQTNTFIMRRDFLKNRRFDGKYKLWDDTQFIIDCCQETKNITYIEKPLSVFFDFSARDRVSQQRQYQQHVEMLAYLEQQEMHNAARYFRAMAVSDSVFCQHPIRAISYVVDGWRAGVSLKRSLFYLARCVLGFGRAKAWTAAIKRRGFAGRRQPVLPTDLMLALRNPPDGQNACPSLSA